MAISGKYSIWEVKNSATIGTLIAIIINLMLTSIHEAAHAFTTKYYKQKVDRGGILLYFGLPCFYVDTNEIWLVGKKARLIVSWAGPWSTIIVSSVATLFLNVFPDFHQSQIIFKIAFWGIIGAIINLNPLLELDGYYMLIDYLKKPMLRVKSILYVRETFKNLVFKKQVSKLEWDKIIYACLAAFWSFLSVVLVVVLIEYRSKIIIKDFIEQNSMIIKILGATVMAFWMLPVIVSIILFVFLKIKELTIAILKTKIFMVPKYLTILLCVPIIVLFFHKDSIVGNLTVACLLALYFIYRYRFLNRSKLFSAIKLNFLFFTVLVVNKYFINPNEFLIVLIIILFMTANLFFIRNIKRKEIYLLSLLPAVSAVFFKNYNLSITGLFCILQIIVLESEIKHLKKKYLVRSKKDDSDGGDLIKIKKVADYTSEVLNNILFKNINKKTKDDIVTYTNETGFFLVDNSFVPKDEISKDIIVLSAKTQKMLSKLLREVLKIFGNFYTHKLTIEIFDSLFWSEKEIFDRYLFPEKDLMQIQTLLNSEFNKVEFLQSVALFSTFSKDQLNDLAENLKIEKYKKKLGLEGRKIILTFGMLSRGKGIEYMIKAMPEIIK